MESFRFKSGDIIFVANPEEDPEEGRRTANRYMKSLNMAIALWDIKHRVFEGVKNKIEYFQDIGNTDYDEFEMLQEAILDIYEEQNIDVDSDELII